MNTTKKLWTIGLAGLLAAACEKTPEIEQLFDASPDERMTARTREVKQALLAAPNGWKGALATNLGGAYAFYIDFKEDNTVDMLADISEASAEHLKKSTYRVKWAMEASLLFDTYNYITLPQDPGIKIPGGTSGNGLQSDVEFEYLRATPDSVFLRGRRYKNSLVMARMSAEEQNSFLNSYKTIIADAKNLISPIKYPYIELDGIPGKVSFLIGTDDKKILAEYQDGEEVKSESGKFGYDLQGLVLPDAMTIGGHTFSRAVIENGKLFLVDMGGNKVEVQGNDLPIIPIGTTFGYNKPNKKMLSEAVPGVTANLDIFANVRQRFTASNRTVAAMHFEFMNSNTARFYIQYQTSTGSFVATATYEYRMEDDSKLFMKRVEFNSNWNTRASQVQRVNQLFGTGEEREFTMEWVPSGDPSVVYPVAAIRSATNPQDMLYGRVGP